MANLTTRQIKILTYLELKEEKNQAPDMVEIIDFIISWVNCKPIDVIRDINTLILKCQVIKERHITVVTYRPVHRL